MESGQGARLLRRVAAGLFVLGLLGAGLVMTAPTAVAAPDDGVGESSRTRYVLDEKARTVKVKSEVTVTNQQPSTATTYYFLTGHAIPIPAGAKKVRATSNGANLPVSTEKVKGTGLEVVTVSFPNLYYGKSRTITWTYELTGAPIRAKKNHIRIGEGYAVFPVIGLGDDGQVTVDVVLPKSMTFTASSGDFTKKTKGRTTTWHSEGDFVDAGVSARDPKAFDEKKIEIGDTKLSLQSFPEDEDWLDFAEKRVTEGMPVLERLTGNEWPGGLETIREDGSAEAVGYAWFDSDADEIVVSEDLDTAILYHEMTHAWINPDLVEGRWLSEGLTEVIAQRATKEVGAKGQKYGKVKRGGKAAFPLLSWDAEGWSQENDAYGYPAAYTAVSAMLSDLTDEQLTHVVDDVYDGRSGYDPADDEISSGPVDWRFFLDIVQRYDTDASPEKPLKTWVLTRAEAKQLKPRAKARKAYAAIDSADGEWMPPLGLRDVMAAWTFEDVDPVIGQLGSASADAAAVQEAAEKADLPVPTAAREAYEGANEEALYRDLATTLPRTAEVITEVGEAAADVEGMQDPLTELGELVLFLDAGAAGARADLDNGYLEDASATAAGVSARADWALVVGLVALLVLVGAAYAAFRVLRSPWARGRRQARRQRRAARKAFLAQVKETKKAGAPWDRPAPPMPPMGGPPMGGPPMPGLPMAGPPMAGPPMAGPPMAGPPGSRPGSPPGPAGSVGGELFGVQRGPLRPPRC
ncbi:LigA [Nocardioidaceae bacterium Broad-1]|nr:LigA [Nocardioidaceae bacterium Broad-1]